MLGNDTSREAAKAHEQAYRQMGVAGRFRIALELSDMTHAFAVAGIRRRGVASNDGEAKKVLAKALYDTSVL